MFESSRFSGIIDRLSHSALVVLVACAAMTLAGCEGLRPATRIADIQARPADYSNREIVIRGQVVDSWSLPVVNVKLYTVNDGSGSIVVRTTAAPPASGARVTVRGRVENVAVLAGKPLGVHLVEVRRSR
jgi:hypothetical protein